MVVVGDDQAGFASDGALQDSVIVGISGDGVDRRTRSNQTSAGDFRNAADQCSNTFVLSSKFVTKHASYFPDNGGRDNEPKKSASAASHRRAFQPLGALNAAT